jgi:hypothetical protein
MDYPTFISRQIFCLTIAYVDIPSLERRVYESRSSFSPWLTPILLQKWVDFTSMPERS